MREQFASQIEVSSFPSTSPQDYASLVIPGRKLVLTFERVGGRQAAIRWVSAGMTTGPCIYDLHIILEHLNPSPLQV